MQTTNQRKVIILAYFMHHAALKKKICKHKNNMFIHILPYF